MTANDRLVARTDGHIAEVMLNRADKYNALDLEMFRELDAAATALRGDPTVRVVVLHGAGDNFCAGIDLSVLQSGGDEAVRTLLAPVAGSPANLAQRAAYAWRELPIPVVCALRGTVFGGGLQIAMGADIRYATPDARLSIMEAKWGILPDMAISTTLRNIVSPDQAKELAFTARVFDAGEAQRLGFVTRIESDPLAAARTLAAEIADKSPDAIRAIKRLINAAWSMPEAEALALEARLQAGLLGTPNQAEAVRANMEKRKAQYAD